MDQARHEGGLGIALAGNRRARCTFRVADQRGF